MPKPWWNAKDDRQAEHVKASERAEGRPERDADRIAYATVNKQRRREGRTKEQILARAKQILAMRSPGG